MKYSSKAYIYVFICTVAVLFSVLFSTVIFRMEDSIAVIDMLNKPVVIIIDPGHGGVDGGAMGKTGVYEKDINLAIAKNLNDLLTASGYTTIMTRDKDISIHDPSARSIRQKKATDLKNRLKLVQSYPNAILISIHQNTYTSGRYSGAQMFYGVNDPESKLLAEMLQTTIVEQLQPENGRKIKKITKDVYLIYNASCPAVLVECGFLTNSAEEQRLIDPEYQRQVAFAIYTGIIKHISKIGG